MLTLIQCVWCVRRPFLKKIWCRLNRRLQSHSFLLEKLIHRSLERRWRINKSEWHFSKFKMPKLASKSSHLYVFILHFNLMVARIRIILENIRPLAIVSSRSSILGITYASDFVTELRPDSQYTSVNFRPFPYRYNGRSPRTHRLPNDPRFKIILQHCFNFVFVVPTKSITWLTHWLWMASINLMLQYFTSW